MYKDFNHKYKKITAITDSDAIKNSIRNIIATRKGSVPGIPEFGSDLHLLVFEQMDYLTKELARRYIKESVGKQEPRINIDEIDIVNEEAFNKILIKLTFTYITDVGTSQDSMSVSLNY